jgi:hypothetical protein
MKILLSRERLRYSSQWQFSMLVGQNHSLVVRMAEMVRARPARVGKGESSGLGTGTEGWVKYQLSNPGCEPELVFIHWNNPFVWDRDTKPMDFSVTTTDVTPSCDADMGHWDAPGDFRTEGPIHLRRSHEIRARFSG